MSARRTRASKPARKARPQDELIELRPGVYLFTPAWATRKGAK
jgi:hypothetical protein